MGNSRTFTRNVPGYCATSWCALLYRRPLQNSPAFETMEHKPVHLICNNEQVVAAIKEKFGGYGARDWTQEEGFHIHISFNWPIDQQRRLSPTREGFVRNARRKFGCYFCKNRGSNYKCQACSLYFKFIWIQSDQHWANTIEYIRRKIETDPLVNIAVPYHPGSGSFEELEAIIEANE